MDAYLAQWVVGGLAKDAFAGRGVFKAVEWVVMYKGDVFAKGRFFKAPKEVGGGGVAETA